MRPALAALWLLLVAACAAAPPTLVATVSDVGVELEASRSVQSAALWDSAGALVMRQRLPAPATRAVLATPLVPGGRYRLTAGASEVWFEVPQRGPVGVEIEAPIGQGKQSVVDGETVPVVRIGAVAAGALILTARQPGPVQVQIGERALTLELGAVGERRVVPLELSGAVSIAVGELHFAIEPRIWSLDDAREAIAIEGIEMPTDALGAVDRARPRDRIALPSAWWRELLRSAGLGYRARDDQAPWGWQTVHLHNRSQTPVQLLVRSEIVDQAGERAVAFRPRLRESAGEVVQVLLRLPAGRTATASLPIFAAGEALPENAAFTRRIEVFALGSSEPLHRIERPLWVSRGSRWASGWLVAALLASGAGWLWLTLGASGWIRRAGTANLVTIALFGSITWVAGTALQIAGLGISAVLGPFSPLLTGLADDTLRACLLGTLIALVPRPGTAALATAVGFVMRGLTMGTFHPVDLLYLGSAVFWLETWLWISGCTRGTAWRDRPLEVWARLTVGLGVSNVCAAATAIVVSVVFYRLYFAGWYVALILALPGFAYISAGCAVAVGFSRALRRVEG